MRIGHFVIACGIAAVLTVGGIAVYKVYTDRDQSADYTLVIDGEEQEALSFSLTEIYPGYSASYSVRIKTPADKPSGLSVHFAGEGTLAPFVEVTFSRGEETLYTATLEECLKGEEILLIAAEKSETKEISLTYSMDLEVGDEAQNTEADFRVIFSAGE